MGNLIIKNSDLDKDKLDIIQWVTTLKDNYSIERLKMLKEGSTNLDWWNEITEVERNAIDKGVEDIKAGRSKPHSEARNLYEKWL